MTYGGQIRSPLSLSRISEDRLSSPVYVSECPIQVMARNARQGLHMRQALEEGASGLETPVDGSSTFTIHKPILVTIPNGCHSFRKGVRPDELWLNDERSGAIDEPVFLPAIGTLDCHRGQSFRKTKCKVKARFNDNHTTSVDVPPPLTDFDGGQPFGKIPYCSKSCAGEDLARLVDKGICAACGNTLVTNPGCRKCRCIQALEGKRFRVEIVLQPARSLEHNPGSILVKRASTEIPRWNNEIGRAHV